MLTLRTKFVGFILLGIFIFFLSFSSLSFLDTKQSQALPSNSSNEKVQKLIDSREVKYTQKERNNLYRQVERLRKKQSELERRILAIPGVHSIGITLRGGDAVFVVNIEEGTSIQKIPKRVGNTNVIVRRTNPVRLLDGNPNCNEGSGPPCHADQTTRPVEMGNSGRWFQSNGGCTMGFKARDLGTDRNVFVTNSHCAQFPTCTLAPLGDSVVHTSNGEASSADNFSVGQISGHAAPSCNSNNNFVDATKVDSAFFDTTSIVRDIGQVSGTFSNLIPGDLIQYSGRSAGRNFGSIAEINITVNIPAQGGFCCGALTMRDQIAFDPAGPVIGGDSGSGVFTLDATNPDSGGQVVGLLWGTDTDRGYLNNIDRVLTALNLTID